ncbi:hypothetical protein Tco_0816006 [Tanacetum coccineum]
MFTRIPQKYECAGDVVDFRTWLGISIRDHNNEYCGFRWSNLFKLVNLDNSTNNILIPLDSWTSGLLEYKFPLSIPTVIAPEYVVSTCTPSSTTIDQDAPPISTLQTPPEIPSPVIPLGVKEADHDIEVAHMDNNSSVEFIILEPSSEESSPHIVIPNHVHLINQPPKHINKWTKDHPINNVIGDRSSSVSTQQ